MAEFNIHNSTVGQINDSGTNIANVQADAAGRKTWWDYFNTWYAIWGTTVGILSTLLAWYVMHLQYNWWFFGLKSG